MSELLKFRQERSLHHVTLVTRLKSTYLHAIELWWAGAFLKFHLVALMWYIFALDAEIAINLLSKANYTSLLRGDYCDEFRCTKVIILDPPATYSVI